MLAELDAVPNAACSESFDVAQRCFQTINKGKADAKGRHALRIAIRELAQQTGDSDIIDAWRSRFDPV